MPRSPDQIDYGLSCNDLYNLVLIMLDSLPDIEEDFSNLALQLLAIQHSDQEQSLRHFYVVVQSDN